ncbi:hypothetical protein [Sulfurimonas autotrophica]|uniref:Uncharacterized protein n=1 Tax=Sulfurimonas autotrophica (strain ATCC BAA-671 / DSM 16294 / JCM 11897 / OK10) TaxID=563040 RepID=E0UTC0_SULAO|nr:hypothetical protein [Sulfurimonas autotrophica]ADN08223.1 hypothetical protein Saut_0174 [Sulfurimonas autotrophica DSM 16294]
MAYYHYQCEHCLQTTYMHDDGKDDDVIVNAFDDCGCTDYDDEYDNYDDDDYDDD